MFKAIIFLKRRADLSPSEFRSWWLDTHRPLAEQLPGLMAHAFNLLPADAPYDAVVEQRFESAEALNNCYNTDAGRAVAADSAAHTSFRLRMVVDASAFDLTAGRK